MLTILLFLANCHLKFVIFDDLIAIFLSRYLCIFEVQLDLMDFIDGTWHWVGKKHTHSFRYWLSGFKLSSFSTWEGCIDTYTRVKRWPGGPDSSCPWTWFPCSCQSFCNSETSFSQWSFWYNPLCWLQYFVAFKWFVPSPSTFLIVNFLRLLISKFRTVCTSFKFQEVSLS